MARKGQIKLKIADVDPIYGSRLLTKLINRSMKDGKKSVSRREVYGAMELIREKSGEDPVIIFDRAMENIKPTMEVRPRRVGGAAYQVPQQVRGPRRESLGIRWLVAAANSKSNTEFHTYADKLASEIMDAAKGEGVSVKKRTDVEKVAEANKAFSHFRW
ncbi:MAG: 30S ribosomal protein S7 [Candidatus Woesebacteria bacterium GW2011_GWB1_39_10]|uniref:Small ribosomal subunit protein uS7 n=3 Tax=Candidatus Woeseibacteriota TaxID=1752722 RepID=A0A0G0P1T1_9BACT|nr:MAG: 30S ribosomal protein S7 [Candidatus Woesebacteria bacterium GW2011_GWB1_39_10]KKS91029.1 MAG: 30S ribosomal protein S7 [Candidatus Woesebacteria bacterium GW2011_GWA1_43_12]